MRALHLLVDDGPLIFLDSLASTSIDSEGAKMSQSNKDVLSPKIGKLLHIAVGDFPERDAMAGHHPVPGHGAGLAGIPQSSIQIEDDGVVLIELVQCAHRSLSLDERRADFLHAAAPVLHHGHMELHEAAAFLLPFIRGRGP